MDVEERNKLVLKSKGLICKAAKEFKKTHHTTFTIPDLIQEGLLVAIEAIDKNMHKIEKGSFSTYVTRCAKYGMIHATCEKDWFIKVPYATRRLMRLSKKGVQFKSEKTIQRIKDGFSIMKGVVDFEKLSYKHKGTSSYFCDDSDTEIANLYELINNTLNEKEKEVIIKNFGLYNTKQTTLLEISKSHGHATNKSSRQTLKNALLKLRKTFQ